MAPAVAMARRPAVAVRRNEKGVMLVPLGPPMLDGRRPCRVRLHLHYRARPPVRGDLAAETSLKSDWRGRAINTVRVLRF
jgi:hypothetical protein